jgi:hypothetical protein
MQLYGKDETDGRRVCVGQELAYFGENSGAGIDDGTVKMDSLQPEIMTNFNDMLPQSSTSTSTPSEAAGEFVRHIFLMKRL